MRNQKNLTEFLGGTRSQIDFLEKLGVMIDFSAEQEVKTLFLVEPVACTIKYYRPVMYSKCTDFSVS